MPVSPKTIVAARPSIDLPSWARDYRSQGFGLCLIEDGAKIPRYRGWSRFSLEPDDFASCPTANIGILGGALSGDTITIDADRPEIRRELLKRFPWTMTDGVWGRGADHLHYRVTDIPEWATASPHVGNGGGGPRLMHFHGADGKPIGLDLIGTGGQVVCPPSLHHSGERRQWIRQECLHTLPYLELWEIIEKLAKDFGATNTDRNKIADLYHESKQRNSKIPGTQTLKQARAYLRKIDPAISGQGGHSTTFRAARCMAYGFDLGADAAFDLLQEIYNPLCQPPWSDAELAHKCHDADTKPFGKPRGWLIDGKSKKVTGKDLAVQWLRNCMEPGVWYPAVELIAYAKEDGISRSTLHRAEGELGVQARKTGQGWEWSRGGPPEGPKVPE